MDPFKFTENIVFRVYNGGKMIDVLRDLPEPEDGFFPEDWVASTVRANNSQHNIPDEGISTAVIDGKEILFEQLVRERAEDLFGSEHCQRFGNNPGFLTKILDSAVRLPLQAHPDPETARSLYHSDYGKTEAWIVLGTREVNGEKPYLMVGFNEKLDQDVFIREGLNGEMTESLLMVNRHEVTAGDVILLRGGLVHAIGPGVFLIEVMEPTDLVVQPELYCGSRQLNLQDRFGNISPDKAMQVFHFDKQSKDDTWNSVSVHSRIVAETAEYREEILLDRRETVFFGAKKLSVNGTWQYRNEEESFCAGIVIAGRVAINTVNPLELRAGETFFLPYSLKNCQISGEGEIIFTQPPLIVS